MEFLDLNTLSSRECYHLGGIALLLALCLVTSQGFTNKLSAIPGPWYTRWTGMVLQYHNIHGRGPSYVHGLHEKYGPLVRIGPDAVDTADVETARRIHRVKSGFEKTTFYQKMLPGRDNLFNTRDMEMHRRHKKLLSQPISENGLRPMIPQIERKARLAVQKMGEEMKSRGAADVFKWWMFMATDNVGELAFGESFGMLESGKKNEYILDLELAGFIGGLNAAFPGISKVLPLIPIASVKNLRESSLRITRYAARVLQRYMDDARNNDNIKPTFFTNVIKEKIDGETMTDDEIINEAEAYIVAGSDTTANALTYSTWAVSRNPEIRAKLAKEVQSLPDSFTEQDLKELPYLNQCIMETLRVYTPAPDGLPRYTPSEGMTVNGQFIPGGTVVRTQAYSLNRDEEAYPDSWTFDPSRWENPTKRMKDAFMPFSGGSRVCIGQHLAQLELRFGVAHYFRTFPNSAVSTLEGMADADMVQALHFVACPVGHRCLIDAS